MRNTLICTVGTSLLNNLKYSQEEAIKQAFESQNWKQLSLLLLKKNNTDRLCGAEINSITSICEKGLLSHKMRLIFLVSDTSDGKNIGQLLKQYYNDKNNPIIFETVDVRTLEGLRDDDVIAFKKEGLKNLVREISTEVRNYSPEVIAINATGGYKAQISFAGMIGQALDIPVYYLFEKFSEVIELPPQPIALDLGFWLDHYLIFEKLELEQTIEKSEFQSELDINYFQSLIDEENIDDTFYVSLSAMGVLFNERSRLQFAKQERTLLSLIPQDDTNPENKAINLRDDHGKDFLTAFAKKLRRSPYVVKIINSLPFNPKQITPIKKVTPDGKIDFVLTGTDSGYGVCIQTTGRNQIETHTIALHLARQFTQ